MGQVSRFQGNKYLEYVSVEEDWFYFDLEFSLLIIRNCYKVSKWFYTIHMLMFYSINIS